MKQTKGRNLIERLIREKDAVLAFAFNKEVPFTNKMAERDIRPGQLVRQTAIFLLAFCLMPGLLPGVAVCTVSAADLNIINYGAVPNDAIHDTEAIQAAIDAAGNGDRVIVPAGKFIIATIYVKSNMTLYLSEGAVLESSPNWRDFSDPWN